MVAGGRRAYLEPGASGLTHFAQTGGGASGSRSNPLAGGSPSADFQCVRCSARLSAAPALQMPETVRDQKMLFAALTCMLFPTEPERSNDVGPGHCHGNQGWRQ